MNTSGSIETAVVKRGAILGDPTTIIGPDWTVEVYAMTADRREQMTQAILRGTEMLEALRDAESAMFHVWADGGFNTPADLDALWKALLRVRALMEAARKETQ